MIDHLGIQVADFDKAAAFYDAVLAPLGGKRILEPAPGVIGYGTGFPNFWIGTEETHGDVRQEAHIAFTAPSREAVQAFRDAAVAPRGRGAARAEGVARVPPRLLRRLRARPRRQQRRGRAPHLRVGALLGRGEVRLGEPVEELVVDLVGACAR